MAETAPNSRGGGPPAQPPGTPPTSGISRRALILLGVMLAAMWFWKSRIEGAENPPIAYSQLYIWIQQGKVQSVVFRGESVDATLKQPEKLEERTVQTFHSNVPPADPALLPLLRDKGVVISVSSQQQPFAVQVVMTLLPWALIIGFWFWMSRRAQGMLSTGGPLGTLTRSQSRKFDKATSVN